MIIMARMSWGLKGGLQELARPGGRRVEEARGLGLCCVFDRYCCIIISIIISSSIIIIISSSSSSSSSIVHCLVSLFAVACVV